MPYKVLLVMSPPRRSRLLPFLEGEDLVMDWVVGFQDAVQKLREVNLYDLLLVNAELADGSWRNLLLFVQNSGLSCEMIICSRLADQQLWAEVIQCGAYDLIAEPFEGHEIMRIIHSAMEGRYMKRFTRSAALAPPAT